MNEDMTWSELVKQTRRDLGLTRQEFASLLGITLRALASWEYQGVMPHPIYQDMVVKLYQNAEEIKDRLEGRRAEYIPQYQIAQCKGKEGGGFWKAVLTGVGIGAVALLLGLTAKKVTKAGGTSQKEKYKHRGDAVTSPLPQVSS